MEIIVKYNKKFINAIILLSLIVIIIGLLFTPSNCNGKTQYIGIRCCETN